MFHAHTLQLGILASGSGSNAQAMLDAVAAGRLDARIKLVLTNCPNAGVLQRAKDANIPALCVDHTAFATREAFDAALAGTLHEYGVDTVALAGFMRMLTPGFLDAFPGRVLNIHPALLPAFPGGHGASDAFSYGVRLAGCTVHFVDAVMDHGPVIIQAAVPVEDHDTAKDLQKRILACEHRIYPQALQWLAEGRLTLHGRRVRLAPGTRLAPVVMENALICPPLEM